MSLVEEDKRIEELIDLFILAGGKSRRMGGKDKGLILLQQMPMIEHVLKRVQSVFYHQSIAIITNHPQNYLFFQSLYPVRLYTDVQPGLGSIGGLYSAFSYSEKTFTAVLACDMPFIHAELLKEGLSSLLQSSADAFVPLVYDQYQPFHAVYRTQPCLAEVKKSIAAGNRRSCAWLENVNITVIELSQIKQGNDHAFFNVNTPQDLDQAEEIWHAM